MSYGVDKLDKYEKKVLTEGQLEPILKELGISIVSEGDTHFSVLCPFHHNNVSSAATVAKETGYFWCFNESCAVRMPLDKWVKKLRKWDAFRTLRFIEQHRGAEKPLSQIIEEKKAKAEDLPDFSLELLQEMQNEFWKSDRAQEYFAFRGLSEYSAKHFGIAYDPGRDMILTPMFSTDGKCVGVIGRSIEGKDFRNSPNLPTNHSLFNIQNAKRSGEDSIILVESNFDAIRVNQAGYKNVVATLGGNFSDYHMTQIYRSFNRVILMIDDDKAGKAFGERIAKKCHKYAIGCYRAKYNEYELFPNGAKDVNDMRDGVLLVDDRAIAKCIKNAEIIV